MRTSRVLIALLLSLPVISSAQQKAPPSQADFKVSLQRVLKQAPAWQEALDRVNIEDLGVRYTIGATFQKGKQVAEQNYYLMMIWARRAQTDGSLYAELNYVTELQAFEASLNDLAGTLVQFDMTTPAEESKVSAWAIELTKIATGPVNKAWVLGLDYTLDRTQKLEQSCKVAVK